MLVSVTDKIEAKSLNASNRENTHHSPAADTHAYQKQEGSFNTKDKDSNKNRGHPSIKNYTALKLAYQFDGIPVHAKIPGIIQNKLAVNTPGDVYEQEADAVAEKVIQSPAKTTVPVAVSTVAANYTMAQRNAEKDQSVEEETEQDKVKPERLIFQRELANSGIEEQETILQRKEFGNRIPCISSAVAKTLHSSGQPLDETTRSFMEQRFGFDFSKVRIHDTGQANQSAKDINALAYTHQQNIVFGAGQYQPQTQTGKKLLAHELTHTLQQSGSVIQRKETTKPAPISAARFIVEDDGSPAEGMMTKSEFLAKLNDAVCTTVDRELQGTPYSSDNCPYIRSVFTRHANSSPAEIEQLAARYEPPTTSAQDATDLIRLILVRVRIAVKQWKQNGSLPDFLEADTGLPGENNVTANKAGNSESENPSLQFKANPGGTSVTQSPVAVMQSLGKGSPMDAGTRGKMENAFGTSFPDVTIHTDNRAASLAGGMNAKAFTVGSHIAFGSGEHQPGTLTGDALMAHELAHVLQQGKTDNPGPLTADSKQYTDLEKEADDAAVGVLSSIWGGLKKNSRKVIPALTSGLALQRCTTSSKGPIGATRLAEARKNFRSENSDLGDTKLDKIDAALAIATKDNLNLLISYYDYYSNHEIVEKLPVTSNNLATTEPNSGTKIRKDLLTPGFSVTTLGSTLIHEYVHTRHNENVMGFGDYQEGEAYGVEYVIAERSGDKARMGKITDIMNNPQQIAMAQSVPALIQNFKVAYAAMIVLYEVVDKGKSSKTIPALTTPAPLTADEARALITEYIAEKEGNRSKRLADLITWIKANLNSFTFPI